MDPKQLVVVIEGTAALGAHWNTILTDYLEKIVRAFAGTGSTGQMTATTNIVFSLVSFKTYGSNCDCLVQRSPWTKNVDMFLDWLSAFPFSGGGFSDAAIVEGLSEALMMFSIIPNGGQCPQNVDLQRHCILIAASNPCPLPSLVFLLQNQNELGRNTEAQPESCLSDTETVAKLFPQHSASLSVICPKKIPLLRAIYNAGNKNPQSPDTLIDNSKSPHFLVLISENFMEARAALSRTGVTNLAQNPSLVEMDVASITSSVGSPPTSIPTVNESIVNRQTASVSNHFKVWEGDLYWNKQGQPVLVTRLEAYRRASAPETLAANWPSTMHIVLVSQDNKISKSFAGKTEFLDFRAMTNHDFLHQLKIKKLCAVIHLPPQTLLLSATDTPCCLTGLLSTKEMVRFRP